MAVSRPDVNFGAVERALAGWQTWAKTGPKTFDLERIRDKLRAAGL